MMLKLAENVRWCCHPITDIREAGVKYWVPKEHPEIEEPRNGWVLEVLERGEWRVVQHVLSPATEEMEAWYASQR
jgi:hypothetical protein